MKKLFTLNLLIAALFVGNYMQAQAVKGQTLLGISNGDRYGTSVSISNDASRIAITGRPGGNNAPYSELWNFDSFSSMWKIDQNQDGNNPATDLYNESRLIRLNDAGNLAFMAQPGKVLIATYNTSTQKWNKGQEIPVSTNIKALEISKDGNFIVISSDAELIAYNWTGTNYAFLFTDPWNPDFMAYTSGGAAIASKFDSKELNLDSYIFTRKEYGDAVALAENGSRAVAVNLLKKTLETYNAPYSVDQTPVNVKPNFIAEGNTTFMDMSGDGNRLAVSQRFGNDYFTDIYNWVNNEWKLFWSLGAVGGGEVEITEDGKFMIVGTPAFDAGEVRVHQIDLPSSIENIEETNFKVYPNPTNGLLNLGELNAESIKVFDNMGRLVMDQDFPASVIDISTLPTGFYALKVASGDKVYSARVVKN